MLTELSEISDTTGITLTLKKERKLIGVPVHKAEARVEVSSQEFLASFWRNECSLTGEKAQRLVSYHSLQTVQTTLDSQPATITFLLEPSTAVCIIFRPVCFCWPFDAGRDSPFCGSEPSRCNEAPTWSYVGKYSTGHPPGIGGWYGSQWGKNSTLFAYGTWHLIQISWIQSPKPHSPWSRQPSRWALQLFGYLGIWLRRKI